MLRNSGVKCALLVAVATVALSGCTTTTTKSNAGSTRSVVTAQETTTTQEPSFTPAPSDFKVDVIVTEQKCFGSAGCTIHYTIDPSYIGLRPLPSANYTVVYQVIGGTQTQIGKFTVDKDQKVRYDDDETIDASEGANLTAKVTKVIAN